MITHIFRRAEETSAGFTTSSRRVDDSALHHESAKADNNLLGQAFNTGHFLIFAVAQLRTACRWLRSSVAPLTECTVRWQGSFGYP